MGLQRKPGAPRLIEWTGERCVPWTPDIQVIYEHFHRYLWAGQLTAGKRVLDLASGEGFGAALLSETAARVVGVDIDDAAVRHAQANYEGDNLEYRISDARDLSQFTDASFDVVVAFELIEHITEQDQVLAEVKRVLTPDGVVLISTPNRDSYVSAGPDGENPFHEKELSLTEFGALLDARFRGHRLWAQHVASGSEFRALDTDDQAPRPAREARDSTSFLIRRDGDEWALSDSLPLLYMVAVASDGELPDLAAASSLADPEMVLLSGRLRELADRLNAEVDWRERELAARGEAIRHLNFQSQLYEEKFRRLSSDAFGARQADARRRLEYIQEHEARMAHTVGGWSARVAALTGEIQGLGVEMQSLREALGYSTWRLQVIEESIIFRATQRFKGKLVATLGGEDSRTVAAARAGLRVLWHLGRKPSTAAEIDTNDVVEPPAIVEPVPIAVESEADVEPPVREFEPISLQMDPYPVISIVIPLYAGAELTYRALASIRDHTVSVPYEVILVNDGDDPDTARLLKVVSGVHFVENDENLGYLRSVNKGSGVARGRWLVLANNDIEVHDGWAAELIDCGESADDIAVVTPMYLQPDGLISEAGGIIWRDASGHNYGRGHGVHEWPYTWRREVDYGSAACLLVRTDVWRQIGGFDERYLPMYYEDADFCFEVRAAGYRVMYEPAARVLHNEGSTAGTDESEGHKRHQAANRPKFREKWATVLDRDHLEPPDQVWDSWAGATARRGKRILVIDHRMPFWDREAGALRTLEILKALMADGYQVTFMPDNGYASEPYATELQRRGIEVMHGADVMSELATIVAPHIGAAIVSRPSVAARYMTLLRHNAPNAELIYDTVDLHWVRESRQAALLSKHHEDELLTPEASWTRALEHALISVADMTLVASRDDRARLAREVPQARVAVLPTINPVRVQAPGISGRRDIIFVGGFQHTPNVDAVLRLVNNVMPLVWEVLPDVRVRVIGADAPPEINTLSSERVEILGWVADIDPLLDAARLTVAPISFGSGMKGKITQALAFGLPVVTTPVGAEGLDGSDEPAALIGRTDAELAEHAIAVLGDDALWQRLSQAGKVLVEQRFSPAVVSTVLDELLHPAADEPEAALSAAAER